MSSDPGPIRFELARSRQGVAPAAGAAVPARRELKRKAMMTGNGRMLGAIALFNVFGSLFFGWAGGHWSKLGLLGGIYIARSIVLACYFAMPPTPASTLVFASAMGFLWLGVGPLVAGSVVEMFGLRWQAMIQGVAFMSHQVGSFVGALGGGLLFDALGSYDLAWRLGVAMGLTAGIVQVAFALMRPPPAPTPIPA